MFLLDPYYFAITAIVTFVYQMFFYTIAATCKFDTVTDLAGGSNFVVLTIMTLILSGSYTTREIVASAFVTIWGARIAGTPPSSVAVWLHGAHRAPTVLV